MWKGMDISVAILFASSSTTFILKASLLWSHAHAR